MDISFELTKNQKTILIILMQVTVLDQIELEYINDRLSDINLLSETLIPADQKSLDPPSFIEIAEYFDGFPLISTVIGELRSRAIRLPLQSREKHKKNRNPWSDLTEDLGVLRVAGLVDIQRSINPIIDEAPRITLTAKGKESAVRILKGRRIIAPVKTDSGMRIFIACAFGRKDVDQLCSEVFEPLCAKYSAIAVRIDQEEPVATISDAVFANIQTSDAMIADLTYSRPSVYFEAGYALGIGIPVLITCRNDHFRSNKEELRVHFDLEQFKISYWKMAENNTIKWESGMHPGSRLAKLLINAFERKVNNDKNDIKPYFKEKMRILFED
jgi:hypothetical protein